MYHPVVSHFFIIYYIAYIHPFMAADADFKIIPAFFNNTFTGSFFEEFRKGNMVDPLRYIQRPVDFAAHVVQNSGYVHIYRVFHNHEYLADYSNPDPVYFGYFPAGYGVHTRQSLPEYFFYIADRNGLIVDPGGYFII